MEFPKDAGDRAGTHTGLAADSEQDKQDKQEDADGDEFGLRYRPQMDPYFLQPTNRPKKHFMPEEAWELQMKSCAHPRWHRENLLGATFFTCVKCGTRRKQAVAPVGGSLTLQEAERLFQERYPAFRDTTTRQEQQNSKVFRQWRELISREQSPAEVAKGVSAEEMLQSEIYRRVTAQVHASTRLESDVQLLARRYTASLQVCQARLRRANSEQVKEQETKDSTDKSEETVTGEGKQQHTKKRVKLLSRMSARDMVMGGYFYACVTLRRTMFLDGQVFQRLRLVHYRLRHMFPGLPRDFPTRIYLEVLIPRVFPQLSTIQKTNNLQARVLDLIYTAARLGLTIHKRSLICCSLIAVAVEMGRDLFEGDVSFLREFDCHFREWPKVMSLFGRLAPVPQRVPEHVQVQMEKLLDDELMATGLGSHRRDKNNQKRWSRKIDSSEAPAAKHRDKEKFGYSFTLYGENCQFASDGEPGENREG